jgi:hypothetical protein
MTATTAPLDDLATRPAGTGRWIATPAFDLAFFILSPLLGFALLAAAPTGPNLITVVVGTLFGVPHYLSTFTFFFWEENQPYHRARWLVFFGGPFLIVATFVLLVLLHVPLIVQVVIYTWNTWHVARQSCGILSIYRHRVGATDLQLRRLTNLAVISTNGTVAFWNIAWNPAVNGFLIRIHPAAPAALRAILAVVAAYAMVRLGVGLLERRRRSNNLYWPELAFLGTSLVLFLPYLWVRDPSLATLAMLMGHFVQYLGVVWLVHRRRFGAERTGAPRPLTLLSTSLPLLVLALLTAGGLFLAIDILSTRAPTIRALYQAMFITVSLVHFYLDGLFWAFSNPQVRKTLGPWLFGRR